MPWRLLDAEGGTQHWVTPTPTLGQMQPGMVGQHGRTTSVSGIPGALARLYSPWMKGEMIKTHTCGLKPVFGSDRH